MKYTGSIHTTFYALLAAAALTAAGCSDDDNEKGGGETGVEANFSAEITPYTRAAGDTWTNGDAVGIYMLGGDAGTADNVRYTCEPNGRLSAADAKIVIPGSGTFDFVAYHPYKQSSLSGDAGKIDGYLYPVVLSDQTDPAAIDLLWSDNATGVTAAAPDVKFTFEHVLSKVEIAVKQGGGISADDLAGVVVTIDGVYNEGFFALNSGRIGNTGVPGAVTARAVTEGISYEAIVLPTTGAAQQGRVFTVEAPLLGRTYTWTMPDDYLFVGGKIHEIEITVDVDGISVVTGDIADWNGGDSNPEVETDDAEFLALPNSYIARPGSTVTIPVAKAYAAWHNIPMLQEGSFSIPNDLTARIVWQERFDEDETILFSTNDKVTMTGSGINAAIEVVLNPDVEGSLVVQIFHLPVLKVRICIAACDEQAYLGHRVRSLAARGTADRRRQRLHGPQSGRHFAREGAAERRMFLPVGPQGSVPRSLYVDDVPQCQRRLVERRYRQVHDAQGSCFDEGSLRESRGFGPAALPLYCGYFRNAGLAVAGCRRRSLPLEQRRRYERRLRPVP